MPSHKLTVSLESRSYSIHIGSGLTKAGGDVLLLPRLRGNQGVVVTNTTIAPLYLRRVQEWLAAAGYESTAIVLPDGEENKNPEILQRLYQAIFKAGLQRNGFICALGGESLAT